MVILTTAQDPLRHNNTYMRKVHRPSIISNDIEGAFNCLLHPTLMNILRHYGFPRSPVETIADFNTNRRIFLEFDEEKEEPVAFNSSLPQRSPLSPNLILIYGTAIGQYKATRTDQATMYIVDEVLLQGAKTQHFATQRLQGRVDSHLARCPALNIRYARPKTELMHFKAGTRAVGDETKICLYDQQIGPAHQLKFLGVWIDHRLGFKRHAALASSRARSSIGMLWKVTKRKGISPGSLHNLITTACVPAFTWGLEIWWTGARHLIDQVAPAYNIMARLFIGLSKWIPLRLLLVEAGLPPLHLYLDMLSRRYGARLLCSQDDHPCKSPLLQAIQKLGPHHCIGTGLAPIADLLSDPKDDAKTLERTECTNKTRLPPPIIGTGTKAREAKEHNSWTQSLQPETILVYIDTTKSADGTTSSALLAVTVTENLIPLTTIFKAKCQIRNKMDIEDGEIHDIKETLHQLNQMAHG